MENDKQVIGKMMLIVVLNILFVLLFPFLALWLLLKVLSTPFDYIKYKRALYQKDFPHKYSWLREPHIDNGAYTAIKKNNLPVEYIRVFEDYDMPGRFVYKDILFWFHPSLLYYGITKQWLWYPGNKNEEYKTYSYDEDDIGDDEINDCLSAEELKSFIITEFNNLVITRECRKIILFYERQRLESKYGKDAVESMRKLDDFVVYEKGKLAKAIEDFIESKTES